MALHFKRDAQRIKTAVDRYFEHSDVMMVSLRAVYIAMRSILGENHMHMAHHPNDLCDLCGHDLRHEIHHVESEPAVDEAIKEANDLFD